MGKISLELFDDGCELISFEYKKENSLTLEFTEELDGYISLGSHHARLKGKSCHIEVRDLAEGEHTPRLILRDKRIDLPKMVNESGAIYPKEHSLTEIGQVSLRERRLGRRVAELEKELLEIKNKVFGSRIFGAEAERKI